ncbi:NACHT and WD repeat domain-containing 2-like [Brachionus plicatilis]|uniref:NACHT and WD repeat domain-containing 2-like n=1 Tax=Brachionus plicatilis TaxID=10195 RepID=A0A3M7RYC7_BRAPC|nr:NACHT and WD repeat domain-containing 2-like [Brachionus plicatilis]
MFLCVQIKSVAYYKLIKNNAFGQKLKQTKFEHSSHDNHFDQLNFFLMKKGVFKNNSNEKIAYSFVRLHKSYKDEYPTQVNTLEYLRDREINYFVPAEQLYRIKVDQCDETYFKNFALYYKKTFEKAVDEIVRENSQYSYDTLNEQVLYHLNYIKLSSINEVAPRTQSIIKLLTDYVLDNTFRQPFILTGDSGSGKTSIISTLASNLFLQLAANDYSSENIPHHAVVVRFIGIDGKCEYLRNLLYSICCQLQYIKTGSLAQMNLVPTNLKELKHFFRKFLTEDWDTDFNKPKRKIILILDSLQDLKKYDYSYKFDWLPKILNPLIKVIISVSSQSKELIERLNRKYSNRQCYGQVESLNYEQVEYMVKKLLSSKMYRLEPSQSDFIFNLIKTKNIPSLGVKIWSEEFLNWKSHTSTDECVLKDTLIKAMLDLRLKIDYFFW